MSEPPSPSSRPQHAAPDQPRLDRTRDRSHPRCLVCGLANPRGLKLEFWVQRDGSVSATFFCDESWQGYPGMLHGGIVSAVLDAAMTNCLFSRGIVAVTGEITVRFRCPVSLDRPAEVVAAVTKSRGPLHILRAELIQNRRLVARAAAKFLERN